MPPAAVSRLRAPNRARDPDHPMDVLILIGGFAVLCALGMPVAYALGLAAVFAALWIDIPLEAVMLKVSDGTDNFALLAIPFFILAGGIMAEGGLAERLVNLAKIFVGFIRGGLALVNILASAFFGCISGSSVADTASIGSVMIPQMVKNGYPRLFAVNVTCAGSLQPLLIPPSHNAVIYSLAAGGTISIADLFLAGAIPGFLLGLCLMTLVLVIARRRNFPKGETIPPRRALKIIVEAFWALLTVVIIIGGILSGVFTPTESAAVACVYAFIVTMFIYRDYKWRELPLLVARVVRTVGIVMILIGFSVAFGYMMALMQVPAKAAALFFALADNKYTLLLLINLLLLVLGTFMDLAPMLLICTPIFLPIVTQFGIDPVHFGIVMILNLGIGLLTPPVGSTLAVGCAIGKVSMEAVSRSILPFYIPMLFVLILVTYIPALSLWLPSLFRF
jgi:tripartite ATP-independent transporter DctM subunit